MDWHFVLGSFAGILQLVGGAYYVVTMLRGESRPNRVTQSLWVALMTIQVLALIQAGPSWPLIMLSAALFNSVIIAALSFTRLGFTGHGTFDYVCLGLTVVVAIIWQLTGDPTTAIALSILVSILAAAPAIYKTYRFPETESVSAWGVVAMAGFLALLSTTKYDFANLAPAIYQFIENSVLTALAYRSRHLHKQVV